MMQAMVLVGVLAICALSGVLLTYRHRRTPGPEEPTGSCPAPTPPVPSPPPATVTPSLPPAAAAVAVKPSQPLLVEVAAAAPAPSTAAAVRRSLSRNSGHNRFAPAAPTAVGRITARAPR
jgi:hypothetical protein